MYVPGLHCGEIPDHLPSLRQTLVRVLPISSKPGLQVKVAIESTVIPDSSTFPLAGGSR